MTYGDVTRVGQRNNTGDTQANFPKIMKQSVINDFMRACIIKDRHRIEQGSGSSIYITSRGLATAKTRDQAELNDPYTSSDRVIGQQTVLLENMRYSKVDIADWDRAQRQEQYFDDLSFDCGSTLARQWDQALTMMIAKGAQLATSELNSTFKKGAKITLPGGATAGSVTGPQLVKAIVQLSAMYDENELDDGLVRYLTLTPTHHSNILVDKSATVQNPLDTRVGGQGGIADGNLSKVGNIMLLPNTIMGAVSALNVAAGDTNWGTTGGAGKQRWANNLVFDYRKTLAASWSPEAVVTAVWRDLSVKVHAGEGDAFLDAMGRGYCLAKMLYGVKHLRESCCGVILIP